MQACTAHSKRWFMIRAPTQSCQPLVHVHNKLMHNQISPLSNSSSTALVVGFRQMKIGMSIYLGIVSMSTFHKLLWWRLSSSSARLMNATVYLISPLSRLRISIGVEARFDRSIVRIQSQQSIHYGTYRHAASYSLSLIHLDCGGKLSSCSVLDSST